MKGMRLVLLAGVFAVAGCAAQQQQRGGVTSGDRPVEKDKVADAHFARIPADGLGGVERARDDVRRFQDEQIRAEQQLAVAEQAAQVAAATVDIAAARENAAKEGLDLAKKSGDRAKIDEAQAALELRSAEREVENAKVDAAGREVDREKASVGVAKARVSLANAQLEQAKYDALVANRDAAADQYEPEAFRSRIDGAVRDLENQEQSLLDAEGRLDRSLARVRELEENLERVPVRGTHEPQPVPE